VKLGEAEQSWAKLGKAGRSWAKLGEAGRSWVKLGEAGRSWAKLGEAGRSWAKLGEAGRSWAKLGEAGHFVHNLHRRKFTILAPLYPYRALYLLLYPNSEYFRPIIKIKYVNFVRVKYSH
jgi:hypothetical protein